jgi:hypothetical protein
MATKAAQSTMNQTHSMAQLRIQPKNGLQLLLLVMLADIDTFTPTMTMNNQELFIEKSLAKIKDKDCARI